MQLTVDDIQGELRRTQRTIDSLRSHQAQNPTQRRADLIRQEEERYRYWEAKLFCATQWED